MSKKEKQEEALKIAIDIIRNDTSISSDIQTLLIAILENVQVMTRTIPTLEGKIHDIELSLKDNEAYKKR